MLVYDLGGGTFDVTLMQIKGTASRPWPPPATCTWAASTGMSGSSSSSAAAFLKEHRLDLHQEVGGWERLMQQSCEAKHTLSARKKPRSCSPTKAAA